MGRSGPTTEVIVSHSVVHEVACDRCHFEGNAAGLSELTAEGEIPEVEICKDGETMTVEKPEMENYGVAEEDYTIGACPEPE